MGARSSEGSPQMPWGHPSRGPAKDFISPTKGERSEQTPCPRPLSKRGAALRENSPLLSSPLPSHPLPSPRLPSQLRSRRSALPEQLPHLAASTLPLRAPPRVTMLAAFAAPRRGSPRLPPRLLGVCSRPSAAARLSRVLGRRSAPGSGSNCGPGVRQPSSRGGGPGRDARRRRSSTRGAERARGRSRPGSPRTAQPGPGLETATAERLGGCRDVRRRPLRPSRACARPNLGRHCSRRRPPPLGRARCPQGSSRNVSGSGFLFALCGPHRLWPGVTPASALKGSV